MEKYIENYRLPPREIGVCLFFIGWRPFRPLLTVSPLPSYDKSPICARKGTSKLPVKLEPTERPRKYPLYLSVEAYTHLVEMSYQAGFTKRPAKEIMEPISRSQPTTLTNNTVKQEAMRSHTPQRQPNARGISSFINELAKYEFYDARPPQIKAYSAQLEELNKPPTWVKYKPRQIRYMTVLPVTMERLEAIAFNFNIYPTQGFSQAAYASLTLEAIGSEWLKPLIPIKAPDNND